MLDRTMNSPGGADGNTQTVAPAGELNSPGYDDAVADARGDPPEIRKAAAPAGDRRNGSSDINSSNPSSHDGARDASADLPLIDKLGKRYGTAILRAWSSRALRALDVRWAATGAPAYKVGEACHD
jgi:hypothetical protein